MVTSGQPVEAEEVSVCLNHPSFWMSFMSLACAAHSASRSFSMSSLCGPHPFPLSGSRLSRPKGCACTGGRAPWLDCPRCTSLLGGATLVVWTCLVLSDFGRGLCLVLCSQRPFSPSVGQYPVTLADSLPITCLLVVARTQRCQLLIPAHSHACCVRQGYLGSSTLCIMCTEMWQTWVQWVTVQKELA